MKILQEKKHWKKVSIWGKIWRISKNIDILEERKYEAIKLVEKSELRYEWEIRRWKKILVNRYILVQDVIAILEAI